ncbi:hypothetical protein GOV13_00125 [Candidatus Pacearchaeota archaeon]|nr:hypothetical protein [Candidatus Pacearchaeota archaeon]
MDISFDLKKEIGEMSHIMNKNFNIFKDKLKDCLLNYSKEEIVRWVTASLAIPKNQIISYRFLSIQQIALSLPKEKFKNEKLDEEKMKKILKITNDLNWDFVEDWAPWKEFEFNFEGKSYQLLPGSLENPLEILDILIRRILPLESFLRGKIGYSIKEELVKILNFEDKISSNLPDKDPGKEVLWVIPSKESIDKIFSVCSEYSPSEQLFKSKEKFEEPKDSAEADSLFSDYPLYKGLFINIPNLIHLFYRKLLEDIRKNTTKKLEEELDKQSEWEIVRALTEMMPEEAIIDNFHIEGSDHVFDKGFHYENKFFMFNVVKEHLESKKILGEIKKIQKKSKEVSDLFNKSEINLNLNEEKIKLDPKTEPFQIILYDGLNGSKISAMNKETLILDYYSLNYLFEDLFDSKSNLIYLAKVINKFREMELIPSPYTTFLDFYDSTKYSHYLFALFKSAIILLDPHMHSTTMEKRQKKRPMWHNQPKAYPQRGSFKIIRGGRVLSPWI